MDIESIGSMNYFNDSGYEDTTSLEGTGEAAAWGDDTSQQLDTTPSSTEGDTTSNLESTFFDYSYPSLFGDFGEAVYDDSGEAVSDDSGEAVSDDSGEAVSDDSSEAVSDTAGDEGYGTAGGGVTRQELLDNPDMLREAGTQGMDLAGVELTLDSDGMLSEESKEEVNELVGYLSDELGGVEVAGQVYVDDSGDVNLHLTAGDGDSVWWQEMGGTVYNVHSHPNGFDETPSQTDLQYEFAGAEDAIVVADGVAGNEDGSDYNVFA